MARTGNGKAGQKGAGLMIWIWALLIVIFVVGEIAMTNLICIWFAGGALAAMIAELFDASIIVQVTIFLVVSLILLIVTRPYAKKRLDFKKQKTNLDAIVGEEAVVIEEIKGAEDPGAVKVEGKVWTARADREETMQPGEKVIIKEIRGVTLIVEREGK